MNGRPLTIPELANAPALLEAWYPGTTGGDAVADVLFGKVDPSGKLPMSFPRNVGQIPISYDELPTGRPFDTTNKYTSRYLDVDNSPQYPFGYGLSYTTFSMSNLQGVGGGGSCRSRSAPTSHNAGSVAGDDVVQLYTARERHEHPPAGAQARGIPAGHARARADTRRSRSRSVARTSASTTTRGSSWSSPGRFDLWVGDSSTGGQHTTFTLR